MNNNKIEELETILHEGRISILGVTESWAHEGIEDAELCIKGYHLYRKDRKIQNKTRGGGVLLYVKEDLVSTRITEGLQENVESVHGSQTSYISYISYFFKQFLYFSYIHLKTPIFPIFTLY